VLRAAEAITPEWLFSLVRLQSFRNHAVSAFTGSAGQQRVPAEFLKQYRVPVPPKAEVMHFSETFNAIVSRQIEMSAVTGHINSLFHVLLHRAFAGDLTATWRAGHMQTLLNEIREQAKLLNLPPPTVGRLATQA
jgi:type I restriction enzyme S subunit